MSRTGDQWINKTGGLGAGESPDLLPGKAGMIAELEQRLTSGELPPDEVETVLTQIRNLKGVKGGVKPGQCGGVKVGQ